MNDFCYILSDLKKPLLILAFILPCVGIFSGCTKKVGAQEASAAIPKIFNSFPSVNTASLSTDQLKAFSAIANDEICPCDCPKSFAACLQNTSCQPAKILGQWIVDRLIEGVPGNLLSERLALEIGSGYLAKQRTIQTDGYHSKGTDKPEIVIVEFADFECGHCKIASESLHTLVQKYPDQIKLIYKHFPLPGHTMAKLAAVATEAAGNQGKFWAMHDAIFGTQSPLNEKLLLGHARTIMGQGSIKKYESDMKNPMVINKVENSLKEASTLKLEGTPSIFFNGRPYHLSFDLVGLELRLKMEQARKFSSCN